MIFNIYSPFLVLSQLGQPLPPAGGTLFEMPLASGYANGAGN